MDMKKLVIIMSICIVLIIGTMAIVVNANKEPIKIITTDFTEKIGKKIVEAYYNPSNQDLQKYYDIKTMESAYNSLLEGKNSVLLSTNPNFTMLSKLEEKNIEIEKYEVLKDAIVFVNNKLNPVTNLTSSDVRKIYSKKITNWSAVGGEDLEIIAYQNGSNDDINNVAVEFMGDNNLPTPKIRLKDESLGGLVTAITKYLDTRKSALGYISYNDTKSSEFSDDCRILTIDGILPDETTISEGEYPGTFSVYLIVRKNMLDNSRVKKLVNYIKSEKGQNVIRECGYIGQ